MSDQHEFNGISGVCCVVWPNGFSAGAPRVCGKYKTDPIHSPAPAQGIAAAPERDYDRSVPPIWQTIAALGSEVPAEEQARLVAERRAERDCRGEVERLKAELAEADEAIDCGQDKQKPCAILDGPCWDHLVARLRSLLRRGARTEWAEGDLSRHAWRAWVAEAEQALGEEK